jgi:hypothetical protein
MTIFDRHVDGHLAGGMHLQNAADDHAIGEHVVIASFPRNVIAVDEIGPET